MTTTAGERLGIMAFALGSSEMIEITSDESAALQTAANDLSEMIDIEQKFDILLENFVELEQELANRVLRGAYRGEHTYAEMFDNKQRFNRRIVNLLTAARLYVDQVKHHMSVIHGREQSKAAEVEALFAKEYKARLAYRVMETLRNFVQHRGLPIHSVTFASRWHGLSTPKEELEFNVSVEIVVEELASDKRVKVAVLNELRAMGEKIDLKPMVREYVEALGVVHVALRSMLDERRKRSTSLIEGAITQFETTYRGGKHTSGMSVVRRQTDGTAVRLFGLNRDAVNYLEALRKRSSHLGLMSRRIVSTGVLAGDAP